MTDSHAQPSTAFEPDEGPTQPSATLPEELAMEAWRDAAPVAPVAPPRPGPRGTLRLRVLAGRGPTGTVLMPAQPRLRTGGKAGDARRAARLARIFVLGIGLLCALDVAWIALHAPPDPPPAPAANGPSQSR
jgi:hypothetical protein